MKCNVHKIHNATMRVLEKTGVKFHHPDAVKVLKEHGIRMEGEVAYFTEEQVMYWIHKAPANIDLYAQNSKHNVTLGGHRSETAPSSGCPQICDKHGVKRAALMEDYVKLAKLYETNPGFNINGGIMVFPNDTPIDSTALLMNFAAYTHSDKALMTGTGDYDEMEALMEMGLAISGSREKFEAQPRYMTIINVNTPLQLDKKMTETLFTFLKYKQPVAIASAAMAGTTSPVTLAGTLTLVNAEVLSTIALSQMVRSGSPVLYASQTTNADLRNGSIAIGSPEGALCYSYCAQMAKFYGLPCRGGGSLSDAKVVNGQAGYESMLSYLACRQNEMNLIVHGAGVLDSYICVSFEKLMMDFEIKEYVERYLRDFEADEETIPEEVIDEVGHLGSYLVEDHTFEFCRREPLTPELAVRGAAANPEFQFEENIDQKLANMLASYVQPQRDPQIIEKLKKILLNRGISMDLLNQIEAM